MQISTQLSDEIDRLLPKIQEEVLRETEQIILVLENNIPTDAETRELIKNEDINTILKNGIRIWRKTYGQTNQNC